MSLCYNLHTEVGAIIRAECIAEHLKENINRLNSCTYWIDHVLCAPPSTLLIKNCCPPPDKIIIKVTYLKFLRIVHSRNGLHQVGSRMVAKIRANITNTQPPTASLQILRMFIGRFVQSIDLWNKQQCENTTTVKQTVLLWLTYKD